MRKIAGPDNPHGIGRSFDMNIKDFLRLTHHRSVSARQSVPLGQATRLPPSFHFGATSATDFISKFIHGGGRRALNPDFTFSRLNAKRGCHD
jgi:hypothetical protein